MWRATTALHALCAYHATFTSINILGNQSNYSAAIYWDVWCTVASWLEHSSPHQLKKSELKPWPGALCCALGQDALLSQSSTLVYKRVPANPGNAGQSNSWLEHSSPHQLKQSEFKPWPGALCCTLGQDALLSQSSTQVYKWVLANSGNAGQSNSAMD